MRFLRRGLLIAVFVALLVAGWRFAAENGEPIRVSYLSGSVEGVRIWLVILCSFAAGAASATALAMLRLLRARLELRRYRRITRDLEAEVHQLRTLPLAPEADGDAADTDGPHLPAVTAERGG